MAPSIFAGKKVLITGGLGFIGSNLALRLVESGARVTIVDSLIWAYGGNMFNIEPIRGRLTVNIGDIRDRYTMDYMVKGQDYIFNLAGQVSHIDSMNDPLTDLDINARSQLSLLESCRQHNPTVRIVYTSSRQVYGKPKYLPADENHPLQPTDVNGINKMAGEWYHLLYNNVHGIKAVSLRLTNVYGPRQLLKHNRQGFIGWFVRQVVEGQKISIYGDGQQRRDLVYVDDVVDAILAVAASDSTWGEVYNLGHHEVVTLVELAKLMAELNGDGSYELIPWPEDKKKIDIGDYYSDYRKLEKAVGWKPRVSLTDGLMATLDYYRKHLAHYI